MAVNPVQTTGQSGVTKSTKVTDDTADSRTSQTLVESEAAVYEKSGQTKATKATYTMDTATLSKISMQVEAKYASLRATVENLFSKQSVKNGEAQGLTYDQIFKKYNGRLKELYQNLEVDKETSLAAQQEISEDGFWGVKQTSQRAIEFAKALSGGDTSKYELLKNAIEEGYKAAEEAWGGELPEICKQTQEATLKGLEEWANQTE